MKTNKTTLASDIELITKILSYRRAHGSQGEREFIRDILAPLNPDTDDIGNFYLKRGDAPVIWSAHIDTMHHDRGGARQLTKIEMEDGDAIMSLHKSAKRSGNCLGADNGAGVFILLRMYEANIPGTYIFHRAEEKGCIGSRWIAKNRADWLAQFKFAIAFDRLGDSEIITHQMGYRTASDLFADELSNDLHALSDGELNLYASDGGVYTDTNEFIDIVSECSNVAVGYERNHGPMEILNLSYLFRLKNAMTQIDVSNLVASRDPKQEEYAYTDKSRSIWADDEFDDVRNNRDDDGRHNLEKMISLCRNYPEVAAELLTQYGVDISEFLEEMEAISGYLPSTALSLDA